MVKWFKLTKHHYFGFFPLGILFVALQELPYFLLPLFHISLTPLTTLPTTFFWLDFLEKCFGIGIILSLIFILRLPLYPQNLFLRAAVVPLANYYIGWGIYSLGFWNLPFFLFFLVAMPPLYYFFLGLWQKNRLTILLSLLFLIAHLANSSLNFIK